MKIGFLTVNLGLQLFVIKNFYLIRIELYNLCKTRLRCDMKPLKCYWFFMEVLQQLAYCLSFVISTNKKHSRYYTTHTCITNILSALIVYFRFNCKIIITHIYGFSYTFETSVYLVVWIILQTVMHFVCPSVSLTVCLSVCLSDCLFRSVSGP